MEEEMMKKMLAMLTDKKELLVFLVNVMLESGKAKNGMVSLSQSLTRPEPNLTPENMARCISSTMLTVAKQSHYIETLATLALIQSQSNSFDADLAIMLSKLGKGSEAVKAMFNAKLNGKN
ncbi:MAG TPA: hypothetical protein VGB67_10225 [Fibrella sp.]|jgi:hypothetical protein